MPWTSINTTWNFSQFVTLAETSISMFQIDKHKAPQSGILVTPDYGLIQTILSSSGYMFRNFVQKRELPLQSFGASDIHPTLFCF